MKPKLVIFDIFKSLLHSPYIFYPYIEILKKSRPLVTWQYIITSNHQDTESLFNSLEEKLFLLCDDRDKINKMKQDHNRKIEETIKKIVIYDDTYQILRELQKKYLLGIISNMTTPYISVFENFELNQYIKYPIFSCTARVSKPNQDIYDEMRMQSLLNFEDMLIIETENEKSLEMPKSLGIQTVFLKRTKPYPDRYESGFFGEIVKFLS